MGLTKASLGYFGSDATSDTTIAVTVDTTGYTHAVVFVKHEDPPTTISMADNKGSGAYTGLTKFDHSNNLLTAQMFWVKIGSPGTSTTVTATFGAGKTWRKIGVWGVNATSGDIALDVEAADQDPGGTGSTAIDAGTLVTTAATVSFMGVAEYSAATYTPGSGWAEDVDDAILMQSRSDASGTLDPVATASTAISWVACAASFKETGAAGPGSGSDSSPVGMSESSANLIRVNIVEETN